VGGRNLGRLYLLQGKFEEVEIQRKQGLARVKSYGQSGWVSRVLLGAAEYDLRMGRFEEALKNSEESWTVAEKIGALNNQRWTLHVKGLVLAAMGSDAEARQVASQLKEMIDAGINKKKIRLYYHLLGEIERASGNYSVAIENLKLALSLESHSPLTVRLDFVNSLALTYYESGDLGSARDQYEKMTTLTTTRLQDGDLYTKSFYMLGKIYEQQGDTSKAIEHYEKFLDLWKDADPGIAETEDAKKRLAGLKIGQF
jgi:tetratricopeptide (TPR) repeat protein